MKYIFLAKEYDLVVGDTFELFYRGIICLHNPYKYYILVRCPKGNPYPRYYTFTPKEDEIGDYELTISLIDDDHQVVDFATFDDIINTKSKYDNLKEYYLSKSIH